MGTEEHVYDSIVDIYIYRNICIHHLVHIYIHMFSFYVYIYICVYIHVHTCLYG